MRNLLRGRKHKRKFGLDRRLIKILGNIVLYAAAFIAVLAFGMWMNDEVGREPRGSLSGRFGESIEIEYAGKEYHYREDVQNILLIGVDKERILETEEAPQDGGQADFLFLLSIDRDNRRITPIQIDRDTITDIPIYGAFGDYAGTRETQLCLAQAFGSDAAANCENTLRAVKDYLCDIEIEHYIALDMDGIDAFNDALGGVTVTLEDDFSAKDPSMTKGATIKLENGQAEIFVRSRMDVSDGTNKSRMKRQRVFIDGAMTLLSDGIEDDLNFAGELFDAIEQHTVTNMERGWLINEIYTCSQYERDDIRQIPGEHLVGEDGFMEFHADEEALKALIVETCFE